MMAIQQVPADYGGMILDFVVVVIWLLAGLGALWWLWNYVIGPFLPPAERTRQKPPYGHDENCPAPWRPLPCRSCTSRVWLTY